MMWFLKIPGVAKIGAALAVVAAIVGAFFVHGRTKKKEGKSEARAEIAEATIKKVVKDVAETNRTKDRVRTDAAERARLHDKYKRDDP